MIRNLFLLFLMTTVVWLAGCNDNISSRPVKVGVLHNLEQGQALDAKLSVAAIEIAVDELNQSGGIDGQPIELIIKSTHASQQHFAQQMRELVEVDQVDVVFGCDHQRCVRQSRAVIEHSDALLFYSGDALGGVANERIFNMGALPTQTLPITIDWAHKQFGKRGVVIAQRDAYSKFCYQLAKLQLEALGGELQLMIVEEGETKVSDYAATLNQFNPDFILNLTTEKLFDVALSAIKQSRTQSAIVSTRLNAQSLSDIDLEQLSDSYVVGSYLNTLGSQENDKFTQKLIQKTGVSFVSAKAVASYAAVHLWAKTARNVDTTDGDLLVSAIDLESFASPAGVIIVDNNNKSIWRKIYIGQLDQTGDAHLVWQSEKSIQPLLLPLIGNEKDWKQLARTSGQGEAAW